MFRNAQRTCTVSAVILLALATATATAQPLTGSGNHLPLVQSWPPPAVPADLALYDPNNLTAGFSGTWGPPATAPVLAPWVGTYQTVGPIPAGINNPTGTTLYRDFTGLAAGFLPTGTYTYFGDLDAGSATTEQFTLHAWDPSGSLITTPWLSVPVYSNATDPNQLPGWSYSSGTYIFDGSTVPGNPSVAFLLETLVDIGQIEVIRSSEWASFGLWAPIPEPGTLCLLGLGAFTLARRRR